MIVRNKKLLPSTSICKKRKNSNNMRHGLLCFLVYVQMSASQDWKNSYDNPLVFACSANQVLNKVISEHNSQYEDRRWNLDCRNEVGPRLCHWSGYVNNYRGLMVFQCDHGGFINGVHSRHRNLHEDRRWTFYCCSKPNYHTSNCFYTDWTNAYDGMMNLNVRNNNYIRGIISEYSPLHRDRRFIFQLCFLRRN